jgi:hypothetical protein
MLYIIEPALRAKAEALPFVERYGGIAHPITANFAGDGLKTLPVSMSLTGAQCFDQGKYINLVPDDRYKSVSYFEGLNSPARIAFSGEKRGIATISQSVRFVAWLNMTRLGYDNQAQVGLMALAAVAAFQDKYPITFAGKSGRMEVTSARVLLDKNSAFGGYTYVDRQHLFMWPYAFFAVEMETVTQLPMRCLEELEAGEPLQCVTQW